MTRKEGEEGPVCWRGPDAYLRVRVQPRASRVQLLGVHGSAIKVALTAPPVEGAANDALCRWLADALRVAKSRVTVVSGARSRNKRVRVEAADADVVFAFCHRWQLPEPARH